MAVDSTVTDSRVLEWVFGLLGGLVTVVVSGVTWFTKSLAHRISVLENTAVRKDDFKEFAERSEQTRKELRDGIIGLHQKVEKSSQDLEDKIDKVIDYLLKEKK